jgi:hypothetical protein
VVKLDCCGCCCLTKKIDRLNYCKTYSINSAEQFYSKEDGIYVSQMKEEDRACCCCASRKFVVRTMPENSIAGIISYNTCKRKSCFSCKCCGNCLQEGCKDYYHCFDILSPEYQIIYRVYFLRCCIKCLERLGYCGTLEFVIKNQNGLTVGKIYGNPSCCQLFGLAKADYTYQRNPINRSDISDFLEKQAYLFFPEVILGYKVKSEGASAIQLIQEGKKAKSEEGIFNVKRIVIDGENAYVITRDYQTEFQGAIAIDGENAYTYDAATLLNGQSPSEFINSSQATQLLANPEASNPYDSQRFAGDALRTDNATGDGETHTVQFGNDSVTFYTSMYGAGDAAFNSYVNSNTNANMFDYD